MNERATPAAAESEAAILSCYLRDPLNTGRAATDAGLFPMHFHFPANAVIFEAMHYLNGERMPVGLVELTKELREWKKLGEAGGAHYLTEISGVEAIPSNVGAYIEDVMNTWLYRQTVFASPKLANLGYEATDPDALREDIYSLLGPLLAPPKKAAKHDVGQIADDIFTEWQRADHTKLFGVSTGIFALDAEIGGLLPGDLVLLMGGTSSGKSAFAQKLCLWFMRHKCRVFDATYEMTARQRTQRLVQMIAQRNLRATMSSQREFGDTAEESFRKAKDELRALKPYLEIMDERGVGIIELCARARNLHADSPFSLCILDHDDLVKGVRLKGASREEELASIAEAWKTLAGQLGCPVVLLSQKTGEKARGSSAKLYAASIALDIVTHDDGSKSIEILKNREGAKGGSVDFKWQGDITSFIEQ